MMSIIIKLLMYLCSIGLRTHYNKYAIVKLSRQFDANILSL